jgi:exodeoxyribonuclease V beta subunit
VTRPFELAAPLPAGRVVIEASAGTGKTYSVAGLVTRVLIERDLAPDALLVTTFTRAAASELRHRIRQRLVEAVQVLDGVTLPKADDPVAQALLASDTATRLERLQRARIAVTEFESVTIGTIHSLCQRILRYDGADLIIDPNGGHTQVLDEVVNDCIIRAAAAGHLDLNATRLTSIAEVAVSNPQSALFVAPGSDAALMTICALVGEIVQEVRRRQRRRVGFDGLLQRAHHLVTAPGSDALVHALQARFRYAVVDEAQDTDVMQWELLNRLFPAEDRTRSLIVVGDPKQSIFSFRGADVDGYIWARSHDTDVRTLDTNFRSDQPLLDQLNALLDGRSFGAGITYREVHAPPGSQTTPLPEHRPVLELVAASEATPYALAQVAAWRVAEALAAKRYAAPEIAVLVGTRTEADAVARSLGAFGIAAVTAGTSSVIASDAAAALRTLFRALAEPRNTGALRLAAIGWFGGLGHQELAGEDSDYLLPFQERLAEWRSVLFKRGIAALLESLLRDAAVLDRIAAKGQLARHLTDLQHLGELLHDTSHGTSADPADLLGLLQSLGALDEKSELVTRRIETDAAAVQVLTIHAAKGLQYPFVVVAKVWSDSTHQVQRKVPHTRPESGTTREIDLGFYDGSVGAESKQRSLSAAQAEDDRLFYVAVTRAMHELLIILPTRDEPTSTAPQRSFGLPIEAQTAADIEHGLASRMERFGRRFRVEAAVNILAGPRPHIEHAPSRKREELRTATAPKALESPRLHWSFSAVTAHKEAAAITVRSGEDEVEPSDVSEAHLTEQASEAAAPLAAIPAGADVGTILHDVLEGLDFAAPDLGEALQPLLAEHATTPALREQHPALTEGLIAALHTPLGGRAPFDLALAGLSRADRRDEVRFDLALAGHSGVTLRRFGDRLLDFLPADDALRPWAERVASGAIAASVRGLLNGSIDLVLRHPVRREYYLIVDYKSNRLAAYHPEAVRRAMEGSHYPLQGLFYSVALFRWLRWRTGHADPSERVRGFAYAFLRGMRGPNTPMDTDGRRHGVFCWEPPAGCIAALSDVLAGEEYL